MDTVRFTLNGQPVEVRGLPGTTTLLRYLRDHAGFMGTKEACAEGDCGACTVAILEERPGAEAAWRAVDSCLLFLPMLQGREVVTVEGLRAPGAAEGEGFHPAQEAIVGTRASQCGFCTPGVVMNLFEACYREDLSPADGDAVDEQVAGNLCRCTGYRPIREAAIQVAGSRPEDRFAQVRRDWVPGPTTLDLATEGQRYLQPGSLAELFAARAAHPSAVMVAGGTDVALEVTQRHRHFPVVIGLEALGELRTFRRHEDGWSLGAGLSHTRLCELLAGEIPALEKMWRFFGARQIRNRGTLGGNLCTASPVGDMSPVMMALGATAIAVGPAGERAVPMAEFFPAYRRTALAADEILLRVEVPHLAPGAFSSAYKVSKRRELDISAVSAGMAVVLDDAGKVASIRLAYGGVAATPVRALKTEAALIGRPWAEAEVLAAAEVLAQDFAPISDVRGSERYRRLVARNLLRGFHLESLRPDRDAPAVRPVGPVNV